MPRRPGYQSPTQHQQVELPTVFLARNYTRQFVRAKVSSGEWQRARAGAYCDTREIGSGYVARRALTLARISALSTTTQATAVFSYVSAALLHGMPTVRTSAQIHVTQPTHPNSRRSRDVRRHVAELPTEHVTTVHGVAVTTPERTIVDCARSLAPVDALIIADAGLHNGADREACREILDRMGPAPGVVRAREILALADDGAESPGESMTRFVLLRAGLPVPETQVRVVTPFGEYWCDLGFREWKLLIEYDGQEKYTARGSTSEAILAERERERAIEGVDGSRVVRVIKRGLWAPGGFLHEVRAHLPLSVVTRAQPRPILMS